MIAVSGTALVEFGNAAPGGLPSIQQIWPKGRRCAMCGLFLGAMDTMVKALPKDG